VSTRGVKFPVKRFLSLRRIAEYRLLCGNAAGQFFDRQYRGLGLGKLILPEFVFLSADLRKAVLRKAYGRDQHEKQKTF
jgi:hypothetical protein